MSAALAYWPDYDESIDRRRQLNAALLALPPRQERVVRRHLGIGCIAATFDEIASEFGVTATRIRQIFEKAYRTVKRNVRRACRAYVPGMLQPHQQNVAAPRPIIARHYEGTFWRLVPVIMEMANAGYAPRAIHQRLTDDFNAATWMGPDRIRMIRAYVPCDYMIGYIIKTERAVE